MQKTMFTTGAVPNARIEDAKLPDGFISSGVIHTDKIISWAEASARAVTASRKPFLDRAFDHACLVSQASRDPSTQVGAAIYRPDNTLASTGYNGFPRGVADTPARYEDRATKYLYVVHAEMNAVVTAREALHGYKLISTAFPCAACAAVIIQAGITEVYAPKPTAEFQERWKASIDAALTMFNEAKVGVYPIGPAENERRRLESEANDRANIAEMIEDEAGEAARREYDQDHPDWRWWSWFPIWLAQRR